MKGEKIIKEIGVYVFAFIVAYILHEVVFYYVWPSSMPPSIPFDTRRKIRDVLKLLIPALGSFLIINTHTHRKLKAIIIGIFVAITAVVLATLQGVDFR